ncbi:MAG: enoyl-CoA hydratase/isomerase family protein [Clostridia bacterium]|nr:enoyl-CoA hydratase/isomerase family protein [Clostridia bacterium]
MSDTVLYQVEDGVAVITLNRPEVLNAVNDELGFALLDRIRQAGKDESVGAVLLTGAGRAFCAGEDLKGQLEAVEQGRANLGDVLRRRYNPIILALKSLPKPVLAAVNGVAAGAGASLALAADLRIASEQASLVEAFVNVGLVPDSGATYFLTRMVGFSRAMEWALTGRRITAEEALQLGVFHRVVPQEELMEQARAWAAQLARGPYSIGLIKRAMEYGATHTLEEALEYEAQLQEAAGRSRDHHEGMAAFVEKRAPRFERR